MANLTQGKRKSFPFHFFIIDLKKSASKNYSYFRIEENTNTDELFIRATQAILKKAFSKRSLIKQF